MSSAQKAFLTDLTAAEMKKLLVARQRIDVLLAEKEKLTSALDKIDAELDKLMDGAGEGKSKSLPSKKAVRKKIKSKKSTKKVTKKTSPKATKKPNKKVAKKDTSRIKLEDVVVKVIKANGGPMGYKELIAVIVKKKLFVSKSSNFDNVLRRTLSTSKLVKRAGRGVYKVA